jgi:pimeloyl-ACP methyl ester carboxylesterase
MKSSTRHTFPAIALGLFAVALLASLSAEQRMSPRVERKTCQAPDGVTIVYSVAGSGDTALVFVHGGMADRTFYDGQLAAFADRYRVIALDLAGHGESGTNRTRWGLPEFGADVKAVVDAEKPRRVVLFGNSLGGPSVLEAALLLAPSERPGPGRVEGMPGRVAGVVGIDTFQDVGHPDTPEYQGAADDNVRQRAKAFREDYPAAMHAMVKMLFHPDADPKLVAETERRMMKMSPAAAGAMLASFVGYNVNASARRLTVPLRTINGDLIPMDVARARKVKPDFDAIIMKHMGHYPMLERPEEFNRHVAAVAQALLK